jgi:hypothetical protein
MTRPLVVVHAAGPSHAPPYNPAHYGRDACSPHSMDRCLYRPAYAPRHPVGRTMGVSLRQLTHTLLYAATLLWALFHLQMGSSVIRLSQSHARRSAPLTRVRYARSACMCIPRASSGASVGAVRMVGGRGRTRRARQPCAVAWDGRTTEGRYAANKQRIGAVLDRLRPCCKQWAADASVCHYVRAVLTTLLASRSSVDESSS